MNDQGEPRDRSQRSRGPNISLRGSSRFGTAQHHQERTENSLMREDPPIKHTNPVCPNELSDVLQTNPPPASRVSFINL